MLNIAEGSNTPWGRAQSVERMHDEFAFAGTAGHGGLKVGSTLNRLIPKSLRNTTNNPYREAGWYEEDCEIAIPLYYLWDRIPLIQRARMNRQRLIASIWRWRPKQAEEAGLPKPVHTNPEGA